MKNKNGKVINLIQAECLGIPFTFYSDCMTQEEYDASFEDEDSTKRGK
jgi:hypothetical protein